MGALEAAAVLALATVAGAVRAPDSGYLLTAPTEFRTDTEERVCVTFFNMPGPNRELTLRFQDYYHRSGGLSIITPVPNDIDADGEDCFDVRVPRFVTWHRGLLTLSVKDNSGLTLANASSEIGISRRGTILLIQTDKPKYRPGDKVFIRVITLWPDLTPITDNIRMVWVNIPGDVRIAQWTDIETSNGLIQLELQLTEEPPLGNWIIRVSTSPGHGTVKLFAVEEYVLPTFEVTVMSPKYLLPGERTLTVEACAKYTFGKPLIGANVTVNVTEKHDYYYRGTWSSSRDRLKSVVDVMMTDDEGCVISDLVITSLTSRRAVINVTVTEFGTGLSQSETSNLRRSYSNDLDISEGDGNQLFIKPALPYYGRIKVKESDGKPAANQTISVCYKSTFKERTSHLKKKPGIPDDELYDAFTKHKDEIQAEFGYTPMFWTTEDTERRTTTRQCRQYISDRAGHVTYLIPPQAHIIDSVDITAHSAEAGSGSSERYRIALTAFFSPSRSYLMLDTHRLPDQLACGSEVTVPLLTTLPDGPRTVRYRVLSRGKIRNTGSVQGSSLTLAVAPELTPEFKLLVFFVLDSGEVVSDAITLKVQPCFAHQVDVSWSKKTAKPGEEASFTVSAAPNSFCGISAVDRSTELLGTDNQITLDTVLQQLRQFVARTSTKSLPVDKYCKKLQTTVARTLKRARDADRSPGADAARESGGGGGGSGGSGVLRSVYSPHRVPRFSTDRLDAIKAFNGMGFIVLSNLAVETRPCYKRVQEVEIPDAVLQAQFAFAGGPLAQSIVGDARPSSGIAADFGESSRGGAGGGGGGGGGDEPPPPEDQIRKFFPEAFLFSIEAIGSSGTKTITREMPDTVTSWVGSAICSHEQEGFGVSNKSTITTFKPFFTEVTLPYSLKRGEILNMSTTVFNYLDSSLSVYVELAASEQYMLAGDAAASGADLCLAAGRSKVTYFPLTFSGIGEVNVTVTARLKDGNCARLNAVALGSDTVVRPIVVKPEGFPQEETTSRSVCVYKGDEPRVERVELIAPEGLIPGSARAFFSVIGDLLSPTYNNLARLLPVPRGGAEPSLLFFVPYIYTRHYLERTGLASASDRQRTDNGMRRGYQSQLRYRRSDGSYSSYGQEDSESSLWLTAFVLKSFKQADVYIDVASPALDQAKNWLQNQQLDNGCFPLIGSVIHKELKGGTERGGISALTAFTVLALWGPVWTDQPVAPSQELNKRAKLAFRCLEQAIPQTNKTLYAEIIIAHAFVALGREQRGRQLVTDLMKKASTDGPDAIFWQGDRSSIYGGSRAVDIEMTAYMVLSLVRLSGQQNMEQAARAVKWINRQRSSLGGFVSIQDTIVALQALSEFGIRIYSPRLSTQVTVDAGGRPSTIKVDSSNRLLLQQRKVPDLELPAELTFKIPPEGCVIVQSIFRYSSRVKVPKPAFSLAMSSEVRPSRDPGNSYALEVCTAYILDAGGSERVVVEVELPSGYVAVSSALRQLRQRTAVKKYDYSKDTVTFTLSNVTDQKICLKFRILRATEVADIKPSVVHVYDLFRPEDRNILEYELTAASAA